MVQQSNCILCHFVLWLTQEYRTVANKFTHYALGVDEINNGNVSIQEALVDNTRIKFYRQHLFHIRRALKSSAWLELGA